MMFPSVSKCALIVACMVGVALAADDVPQQTNLRGGDINMVFDEAESQRFLKLISIDDDEEAERLLEAYEDAMDEEYGLEDDENVIYDFDDNEEHDFSRELADGKHIKQTKAANARITLVNVGRTLNEKEKKRAAIRACRVIRNSSVKPKGVKTMSCYFGGQKLDGNDLNARLDVTFYATCTENNGLCPWKPKKILDDFFALSNQKKSLATMFAGTKSVSAMSGMTALKLRKTGSVAKKDPCAKKTNKKKCKELDGCRWRKTGGGFCIPDVVSKKKKAERAEKRAAERAERADA